MFSEICPEIRPEFSGEFPPHSWQVEKSFPQIPDFCTSRDLKFQTKSHQNRSDKRGLLQDFHLVVVVVSVVFVVLVS